MAWRRQPRNLTKELFYNGTTIDGSRLEKAVGEVVDGINELDKGNTKQRFVATQYHAGFNPQDRSAATKYGKFPWLKMRNDDVLGSSVEGAPFNILRFKGTMVPGIENFQSTVGATTSLGDQFAWTRMFHFSRPAILYGVSVMMHIDGGANGARPYTGTRDPAVVPVPYTYNNTGLGGAAGPPPGFTPTDNTVDVPLVVDVMNPGSPEDAELTDVEVTRTQWAVNEEMFSLIAPSPSAVGWTDMTPHYDSTGVTDTRALGGRIVEYRDLNIPIHEQGRVRLAVSIPLYDGTVYTRGTWGADPWYLQAWSITLTVLEEVQSL
jgi:hypothetical protein